jgi:hypothetical protein
MHSLEYPAQRLSSDKIDVNLNIKMSDFIKAAWVFNIHEFH